MGPRDVARTSIRAGLWAGAAMMPFGIVLRTLGHQVNVYGELAVRSVLGSAPMFAQLAFHALVSISLAVPFVALARSRGAAGLAAGAFYGVLSWAALNATLLPLWFGRPTGWALGIAEIWPSLVIHVVYGVVLGAVSTCPGASCESRPQQ